MKLQLLVPQYKETEEVIKPLLDSIAIQQNVDFKEIGVIICNDGSDVLLSRKFLNKYPFEIQYHKMQHGGVSAMRNACFDKATADYVMWCDADDMFCNVCGLWIILKEIDVGFDGLLSLFIEETRTLETREVTYVNRERDGIFVHGKVYKRQYLLDNNIRWNENLTIHEDSFFNLLAQNLSKNIKYCSTAFYLWKWRDDSVCRHDPKYMLKTYNNMLSSNEALVDEFIRREMESKAAFYVVFMCFDAYYTMNKPEWINQENKQYRDDTEKRFAEWFLKFEKYWKEVPDEQKMKVSNGVRTRVVGEGMKMEKVTIDGWLKKIRKLGRTK